MNSFYFDIPHILFFYWDKKAQVLEFVFFNRKAVYIYIGGH